MSLAPLLQADRIILLHALAAFAALGLGIFQFWRVKGTRSHRAFGWIWVALMTAVTLSAFGIHEIRLWGPWSPIHLLGVFTLVMLPLGVPAARRHRVETHRRAMIGIFIGALVIAGLFTFAPGRIIYRVAFGG